MKKETRGLATYDSLGAYVLVNNKGYTTGWLPLEGWIKDDFEPNFEYTGKLGKKYVLPLALFM